MENRQASDLSIRVARELKAAQIRLGFTWTAIEQATGIKHATMQRMLNGYVDIRIDRLMLICEAAGISVIDILEDATRHMPGNYLQSLLVSPDESAPTSNVAAKRSQDWGTYNGKKAADVDHEDDEDTPA